MKFKIDENLPVEAVLLLPESGHDALSVHDQGLRGASDARLRDICKAEERVPITLDLDFFRLANLSGYARLHPPTIAPAGQRPCP